MKPEFLKKNKALSTISKKLFPNLMLHKKAEGLPLKINWRRIFILPTKPGLFFGFISSLMLIASLNFNNNMGLMMTFLLFGLAQVSLHQVFFNIRNLIIHNVTVQPVFAGEKAEFNVHFKSDEAKHDICIKHHSDQKQKLSAQLSELPVDKTKHITYALLSTQRGWLKLGKVKIYSSYPFGLFFAWIWTKIDTACLVYPKPEASPPPLPNHAQNEGQISMIKQGEEFHGLKPFQPGDAKNLIAWKRTAQTGELISREFQQTIGKKLLLDYSQLTLIDIEKKLSRLTAWVMIAHQNQLGYRLKMPNFDSGYGQSLQHYHECLKALALFSLPNHSDPS